MEGRRREGWRNRWTPRTHFPTQSRPPTLGQGGWGEEKGVGDNAWRRNGDGEWKGNFWVAKGKICHLREKEKLGGLNNK